MRLRNKKIINKLFFYSDINNYKNKCDSYLIGDLIQNENFTIQKYLICDTIKVGIPKLSGYPETHLFMIFFKFWAWAILFSSILGIWLIANAASKGSFDLHFISTSIITTFTISLGLFYNIILHPKIFFKYAKIRMHFYRKKRDEKFQEESESIQKMLDSNIQLQRKLKMEKIK